MCKTPQNFLNLSSNSVFKFDKIEYNMIVPFLFPKKIFYFQKK